MRRSMSRFRSMLLLTALAPGACSSLRDQAVPGCPYCGDPVTRVGADGRAEVVPRLRIAAWASAAAPQSADAGVGGEGQPLPTR